MEKKRRINEKIKKEEYEKTDNIVKRCLRVDKDLEIENVFFEATLMRDYYEAEKKLNCVDEDEAKSFNEKLFEFCLGWLSEDAELKADFEKNYVDKKKSELEKLIKTGTLGNLGQDVAKKAIAEKYREYPKKLAEAINRELNENKPIDLETVLETKVKASFDIARMMMNATPDILVIYKIDDKRYAKALECKYLSDEGRYKDVAGVKCNMQLFIQECIMSFCFGAREKNLQGKLHYPVCPSKGEVWGYKKSGKGKVEEKRLIEEYEKRREQLWENLFMYIYKKILEQPREDRGVINAGVEMIRFRNTENETKEGGNPDGDGEIDIEINSIM